MTESPQPEEEPVGDADDQGQSSAEPQEDRANGSDDEKERASGFEPPA